MLFESSLLGKMKMKKERIRVSTLAFCKRLNSFTYLLVYIRLLPFRNHPDKTEISNSRNGLKRSFINLP